MPATADAFRLGVNYWPAQTAMEWLPRYDPGVVRDDFARIAAAGMDTVRIFLRWEGLQPVPTSIDRVALASVVDTADAASEANLDLIVTLFTASRRRSPPGSTSNRPRRGTRSGPGSRYAPRPACRRERSLRPTQP